MNESVPVPTPLPSDADLDRYREVMDPVADAAAAAIYATHNIRGVRKLLHFMALNDSSVDLEIDGFSLPDEVKAYFNDLRLFTFGEKEKQILDEAADIFSKHASTMTFNLAVRSLCKQYAAAKATNVLRMTTLLNKHTDRRVTETFQFVLDVMHPGWYEKGQRGIRSIQMLRLIHALIRFRILHGMTDESQGKWDSAWGNPINQEDMIFANQTFSIEIVDGMTQIGVDLSDEEQETFYQAWVLIGKALGVLPELHMPDLNSARVLQEKIYDRQFKPNPNAPQLTTSLVDWLIDVIPIEVGEKSIITFIKFFNGEDNYWIFQDILKLDVDPGYHHFHKHVHQELKILDDHEANHESLQTLSAQDLESGTYSPEAQRLILDSLSLKLLLGLFRSKRGSKSTGFQVDDAFADRWGLPGNEGIPPPQMPPVDTPKKKHPIISWLFKLASHCLALLVKIRDWFHQDKN